jgi:hypothetical protein
MEWIPISIAIKIIQIQIGIAIAIDETRRIWRQQIDGALGGAATNPAL